MDESAQDTLNRFWNDLAAPENLPHDNLFPGDQLPLETADAVQRLHAMSRAAPPLAVRQRLDRRVAPVFRLQPVSLNGATPRGAHRGSATLTAPVSPRDGLAAHPRPTPLPPPAGLPWRRRAPVYLATALLVLAAVTLGLLVTGLGRSATQRGIVAGDAPLAEITVPAAMLPQSERASASLAYFTVEPGEASDWTAEYGACCPGFRADHVLAGELTVHSTGMTYLARPGDGATPALVPDGSDVVVTPGDTVITRYTDAVTFRNAGTAQVGLLDVNLVDGFFPLVADPPGWTMHPDGQWVISLQIPRQGATLRLEAVDLASGASLPLPPDAITQLGVTLADGFPLDTENAGPISNPNPETVTVHVATLLPAPANATSQ